MNSDDDTVVLSEKSVETLRAIRRWPWDEIVTTRVDGTEEYWRIDRRVRPHADWGPIPRIHQTEQDLKRAVEEGLLITNKYESTWCEWPIESHYREGFCGRSAAKNIWGLSLCWQHEDSPVHHVVSGLHNGRYGHPLVDRIADALFAATYTGSYTGEPYLVGTVAVAEAVEDAVRGRLKDLAEKLAAGEPSDLVNDYTLNLLLDKLLEQRLQEKWGPDE